MSSEFQSGQLKEDARVQVLVRDNNVDQALKALKKKMQREGIFREMKLRGHYEKPSEKKAREKAEAVRRARKLARKKMQREGLIPMKPKPDAGRRAPSGRSAAGGRGGRGGLVRADRAERTLFQPILNKNAGLTVRVFVCDQCPASRACGAIGGFTAGSQPGRPILRPTAHRRRQTCGRASLLEQRLPRDERPRRFRNIGRRNQPAHGRRGRTAVSLPSAQRRD